MASTKTQQSMVFLTEGGTGPVVAPAADHVPACLVGRRPERVHKSGTLQSARESSEEVEFSGKPKMHPVKEAIMRIGEKHPTHSNNLAPDSICKAVKVTLDNNSMWNEFFRCRTEMILTKQGSRMFPYCRFHISGLQSHKKYSLIMDIHPLDNYQYKWTGESWQVSRKGECFLNSKPFVHPESPATGQHWMQSPVSFYKLKLTNNISDQEGNVILHPMHRYIPRLHLVETDKPVEDIRLKGANVLTFTFPQTEFLTVTTYQNPQFSLLKVNYNPFAKRLKEDGLNSWDLKLKTNLGKVLNKDGTNAVTEQHPVKKNLKFLLANHKPRCSKTGDCKPPPLKDLQNTSVTAKDHSAVPEESPSSNATSTQKLFSELICEAHVSLQRCQREQVGISTSTRAAESNTKTTAVTEGRNLSVGHRDNTSLSTPLSKSETIETLRKTKEDKHHCNSLDFVNKIRSSSSTDAALSSGCHISSKDSDHQHTSGTASETTKQQKRPARLPLPALALFLKQHSAKHKKTPSKLPFPPQAPPSAGSHHEAPINNAPECRRHDQDPDEMVFNITGQEVPETEQPSCPLNVGAVTPSVLVETKTDEPLTSTSGSLVPYDKPVTPNSEKTCCTLKVFPGTCATSSASSHLSPRCNTVLSLPNSPKTATECSTQPSDTHTVKTDSLLFDPECSSFDFDPLSPVSSSEPLPSLPACLALDIDSTSSVAAGTTESAQDPEQIKNSSVFKWHTVLPPSDTYEDSSYTTFQPPQQASSLMSLTPPVLPCHPEPQSLNISTSANDPVPSFEESEPPLPFPAEFSPLALQLSLSPTFSSLDEDGLSPTPSLSELVHFFSNDVDIGIGGEFSNTETTAVPCPPPLVAETQESSLQVQPVLARKPCKRRKSSKSRKVARLDPNQNMDDYRSLQPNLDEVEEQLFISFTSKEALKLHVADACEEPNPQPQLTPDGQQTGEETKSSNNEMLKETIADFQKILLKDLELMKYRQVIHPVLQEVGLKMTLLDPALSIDLQYLGVRLPIPPFGIGLEQLTQTLPSSQGVSATFQSRTGKTTDVTQIKGWREKFTPPPEATLTSLSRSEAGPSSDPQKKNLSAFCSDMLDEYLENEGKLIDERAASFSQPPVEPPVYKVPVSSTSYVQTVDHILKKQATVSPASDLISGFIPPSKRPRLKETKTCRRAERKQRCPKPNKSSPAVPKHPGDLPQTTTPSELPIFQKQRKHKPTTSSQTLSPSRSGALLQNVSGDLAPVESDSELGQTSGQSIDTCKRESRPMLTRALLRQGDLEDNVVREGCFRTSITEERAAIALTSLFTLTGFARENPTAPIQLTQRHMSPCLNEFCRLGCICSSLSYSSRTSHCGRPPCMFGCSCLKQKVVLLKNLDSSDSSPTSHSGKTKKKKKRKRRRMKMAYILKEADSVSQPAERVRFLWRRTVGDADPDPVHIPDLAPPAVTRKIFRNSCARVRGYRGKIQKEKEASNVVSRAPHKAAGRKVIKQVLTLKKTKAKTSSSDSAADADLWLPPKSPPSPPAESSPKPSKRLVILADCKWASDSDRSYVVKKLCEAMAREQLNQAFWVKKYLISPIDEAVEGSGAKQCIQYRVQISTPTLKMEQAAAPVKPSSQRVKIRKAAAQHKQNHNLKRVSNKVAPPKGLLREMEEKKTLEVRQKEAKESAGPVEDWQREVEESDTDEGERGSSTKAEDGQERSAEDIKLEINKKRKSVMAVPFLTGVSPVGILTANRKQPGGTEHPIQVNGKFYPLARIQLGRMGALHPANRLAAYLTGRVRSQRQQPSSLSSSELSSKPQSSALTHHSVSSASAEPSSLTVTATSPPPSGTQLCCTTPSTDPQPKNSSNLLLVPTPPKDSKVLWVQLPGSCKTLSPLPQEVPAVRFTGQKMVLQPVQSTSGSQYYRKPDGSLIQLVPLHQLKPFKLKPPVQEGVSSSVVAASGPQTSAGTADKRPTLTPLTKSSSSSSLPSVVYSSVPLSSSLGSLSSSSSLTPNANPLQTPPVALANQDTCTPKFQSPGFSKDPIITTLSTPQVVTAPTPPVVTAPTPQVVTAPGSLPQLQVISPPVASVDQQTEQGVKTVTVTSVSDGFNVVFQHKTASSQTPSTLRPPAEASVPNALPPHAPSPTPSPPAERPNPEQELAYNPVDLDIVYVEDEAELFNKGTQPADEVYVLSSSETENSSDFRESDSEEETPLMTGGRHLLNVLEKKRRQHLQCMFQDLRTEVVKTKEVPTVSKISTLQKAVELIQELKCTAEALKRTKRRLRRRRDDYLSRINSSAADQTDAVEVVDPSDRLLVISSDEETLTDTDSARSEDTNAAGGLTGQLSPGQQEQEAQGGAMMKLKEKSGCGAAHGGEEIWSSDLDNKKETLTRSRAGTQLINQASQQTLIISRVSEELKVDRNNERDSDIKQLCSNSGEKNVLQSLAKQEMKEKHQVANEIAPGGEASVAPSTGDPKNDVIIKPIDPDSVTQAPPSCVLEVSNPDVLTAVKMQPHSQNVPQFLNCDGLQTSFFSFTPEEMRQTKTFPNILSHNKKPPQPSSLKQNSLQGKPLSSEIQAEVLSLVGKALPGQPVLNLNPVIVGTTVLQRARIPGVNILSLPKQEIPVTSLLPPSVVEICSSPAPFTVTQFSSLSCIIQSGTTQQQTQLVQQPTTQQTQHAEPEQPQPSVSPLDAAAHSSLWFSNESNLTRNLEETPSQTIRPASPGPGAPQHPDNKNGKALLNQHTVTIATTALVPSPAEPSFQDLSVQCKVKDQRHASGSQLRQLDSVDAVLNGLPESKQGSGLPGPPVGCTNGGVLAPPPLLHMKMGSAKVAGLPSKDGTAVEAGERGRDGGGVAWRPMPRLVPLGLRGNSPS